MTNEEAINLFCFSDWIQCLKMPKEDLERIVEAMSIVGKICINQSAYIDREAWEPCAKCVGCGNCYYFLYDDDEYPCNKCLKESTDKNQYPKFEPIGFCKHCGRPLTDEAVQMVMERMEKLHEDNGCS